MALLGFLAHSKYRAPASNGQRATCLDSFLQPVSDPKEIRTKTTQEPQLQGQPGSRTQKDVLPKDQRQGKAVSHEVQDAVCSSATLRARARPSRWRPTVYRPLDS